jgi:hypothetical protein
MEYLEREGIKNFLWPEEGTLYPQGFPSVFATQRTRHAVFLPQGTCTLRARIGLCNFATNG